MKKDEYINRIAQALQPYDSVYAKEILSDYEEHFANALAEGQSEEEICRSLGDVEDIIEEIKALMPECPREMNAVAQPFEAISQTAGSDEEAQNSKQADGDTFRLRRLSFKGGSASIHLRPAVNGQLYIYTEDPDDMDKLDGYFTSDSYFGKVGSRRGTGNLGMDILHGILGTSVEDIYIEIPCGLEKIQIETFSGDIFAEQVTCGNLELASFSGDIYTKNIQSHCSAITSKSGDIHIEDIQEDLCDIKTISGDIRVKQAAIPQMHINTTSGDIRVSRISLRDASFKTVSGDISVKLCPSVDEPVHFYATAKTVSGDVRIKNGMRVSEEDFYQIDLANHRKIQLKSVSGDISVRTHKQ